MHSTKSEKQLLIHARYKYSVIMTSAAKKRCFKKQNSYQVEIDNISFRCGGIRCTFIIELCFSCSSASWSCRRKSDTESFKQTTQRTMQSVLRKEYIAMVTSPQHFSDWKRLGQGQHPSRSEKPNQERLLQENGQTDRIRCFTCAFWSSKITRAMVSFFSDRAAWQTDEIVRQNRNSSLGYKQFNLANSL